MHKLQQHLYGWVCDHPTFDILTINYFFIMIAYSTAGSVGVDYGGFNQDQGGSLVSYYQLEFILNVCLFLFCKLIA